MNDLKKTIDDLKKELKIKKDKRFIKIISLILFGITSVYIISTNLNILFSVGHINVILLAKLGFGLSFSLLSLTNFLSLKKNNNIKELQDKINYLEKKLEEELINEKEINKEKNIYHSYEENLNKDIFIKDENKNLKRVRKKR